MRGASERANGRASGPVLTSLFLFVPDHSAAAYAGGGGYGADPTPAAGLLDPTKLAAAAGFSAPMAGVAAQYGQQLADQGRVQVEQKLESWFAISKLKYYFAVDNSYVGKKLALLLFPYAQRYFTEGFLPSLDDPRT